MMRLFGYDDFLRVLYDTFDMGTATHVDSTSLLSGMAPDTHFIYAAAVGFRLGVNQTPNKRIAGL
ncbi:MAG: hypothetical protein LC652_04750 [Halomonas sp.]|nr:hypothetical protein [Halomonas sp.]